MFKTPRFDSPEEHKVDSQNSRPDDTSSSVSSRRSQTAPTAAPGRAKRLSAALVGVLMLGSLTAGFLGGYLGSASQKSNGLLNGGNIARQKEIAANESQLIAAIAKSVGPSVVSVNVLAETAASSDFFGFTIPGRQQAAAGTGIVLSSEGVIVTNRHVVPVGVTDVNITLADGTRLDDVTVLGRTNENDSLDIAFLKINDLEGQKLTPAVIGDSGKVQVGDTVVAIGNALGQFENTVTSGIISGYGRSVVASGSGSPTDAESLEDLFQTDAAINQGNSGGPLVNTDGQVIGINTAVAGEGQNIGFAIPINDVSGLIRQVLSSGKFERPYLGVRYVGLTADVAKQYELDVERGAYVLPSADQGRPSVVPDSPADQAGIREGDIITAIEGTKIDESHSLTSLIGQHSVGDKVAITVLRDGKNLRLHANLVAMPSTNE